MRISFTQVLYIIINNDVHSSMMIVINTVTEEMLSWSMCMFIVEN